MAGTTRSTEGDVGRWVESRSTRDGESLVRLDNLGRGKGTCCGKRPRDIWGAVPRKEANRWSRGPDDWTGVGQKNSVKIVQSSASSEPTCSKPQGGRESSGQFIVRLLNWTEGGEKILKAKAQIGARFFPAKSKEGPDKERLKKKQGGA